MQVRLAMLQGTPLEERLQKHRNMFWIKAEHVAVSEPHSQHCEADTAMDQKLPLSACGDGPGYGGHISRIDTKARPVLYPAMEPNTRSSSTRKNSRRKLRGREV